MANKKIHATAQLFLNTEDAQKDAKRFIADLKGKLQDIESAADKMTVFKDMVDYIAQVDRALTALKTKNKDVFAHMFDGLDVNLKKQLEGIFGVDGIKLGQLDALRDSLGMLNLKSSIGEVRKFANELNSLFASVGMDAPFKNIEKEFEGRTKTAHIEKLTNKLSEFATVWGGLSAKLAGGFNFGSASGSDSGGGFGDGVLSEVEMLIKHLDEKNQELIKAKERLDNTLKDFNDAKTKDISDTYKVDLTEDSIQNLTIEYDRLQSELERADASSVDFYNTLTKLIEISLKLKKAYKDISADEGLKNIFSNTAAGAGTGDPTLLARLSRYAHSKDPMNKDTMAIIKKDYLQSAINNNSVLISDLRTHNDINAVIEKRIALQDKLIKKMEKHSEMYGEYMFEDDIEKADEMDVQMHNLEAEIAKLIGLEGKVDQVSDLMRKFAEDDMAIDDALQELYKKFKLETPGDFRKRLEAMVAEIRALDTTIPGGSEGGTGTGTGYGTGAGTGGNGGGVSGTVTAEVDFTTLENTIKTAVGSIADKLDGNTFKVEVVKDHAEDIRSSINNILGTIQQIESRFHVDKEKTDVDNMKKNILQLLDVVNKHNAGKTMGGLYQRQELGVSLMSDGGLSVNYGDEGSVSWSHIAESLLANLNKTLIADIHTHPLHELLDGQTFVSDMFSGSSGDLGAFRFSKSLGAKVAGMLTGNVLRLLNVDALKSDTMNRFRSELAKVENEYVDSGLHSKYIKRNKNGKIMFNSNGSIEDIHKVSELVESMMYDAFERVGYSRQDVDENLFKKYNLTDDAQLTELASRLVQLTYSAEQAESPLSRLRHIISDFGGDVSTDKASELLQAYNKGEMKASEVFNKLVNNPNFNVNESAIQSLLNINNARQASPVETLLVNISSILSNINTLVGNIEARTKQNNEQQINGAIQDLLDLRSGVVNDGLNSGIQSIYNNKDATKYRYDDVESRAAHEVNEFLDLWQRKSSGGTIAKTELQEALLLIEKFKTALTYVQDLGKQRELLTGGPTAGGDYIDPSSGEVLGSVLGGKFGSAVGSYDKLYSALTNAEKLLDPMIMQLIELRDGAYAHPEEASNSELNTTLSSLETAIHYLNSELADLRTELSHLKGGSGNLTQGDISAAIKEGVFAKEFASGYKKMEFHDFVDYDDSVDMWVSNITGELFDSLDDAMKEFDNYFSEFYMSTDPNNRFFGTKEEAFDRIAQQPLPNDDNNFATVIVDAINDQTGKIVQAIKLILPERISSNTLPNGTLVDEDRISSAFETVATSAMTWSDNYHGSPRSFFKELLRTDGNSSVHIDDSLMGALKTLGMMSQDGVPTFTIAKEGMRNLGVAIAESFVIPTRPSELDQTSKLTPMLNEAVRLGAAIPRIINSISDADKVFELQTRMKGENIRHSSDFLNASTEQIDGLLHTFEVMSKVGLFPDFIGDNVLFDPQKGFSLVDIESENIVRGRDVGTADGMGEWFLHYAKKLLPLSDFKDFESRFRERMALPSEQRLVNEHTVAQTNAQGDHIDVSKDIANLDILLNRVREVAGEIRSLAVEVSGMIEDISDPFKKKQNGDDTFVDEAEISRIQAIYNSEDDSAKRAIDELAVFYKEYSDLKNTMHQAFPVADEENLTDSEKEKVLNAFAQIKQKKIELANSDLGTEEDIKEIRQLKAEMIGLQAIIQSVWHWDSNKKDYQKRFGLSDQDADFFYDLITGEQVNDLDRELNKEYSDKEFNVFRTASHYFTDVMNDLDSGMDDFLLAHARSLGQTDESGVDAIGGNVLDEIEKLSQLKGVLTEVKGAIDTKTKAFVDEGNVVGQVVGKEISALKNLSGAVDEITPKVEALTTKMASIDPIDLVVKSEDGNAGTSSSAESTKDKFQTRVDHKKGTMTKYINELKDVQYVSDDTKKQLVGLRDAMDTVKTPKDLNDILEKFEALQTRIGILRETFEDTGLAPIRGAKNSLLSSFKTLNLDQQLDIEKDLDEAILKLNTYENDVLNGHKVELKAINDTVKALREKIEVYKEANKEAKKTETPASGNASFGSTASINATAKYNSLSRIATSDQFANSAEVANRLDQYTKAYKEMIAERNKLRSQDVISEDDKERFKALTTECNNYAKALDKLIQNTLKLKSNKANPEDYMLGADFVDDKQGRIDALTNFAKEVYGVNLAATDFTDNWNKAVFAIDNGDGTFTKMTATFTDARNEIVATAGETKKAQGAFAAFFDELKGKFKSIGAYLLASFSFHEVWAVIKRGINYVKEIDTALTELKKVTDETDASYAKFLKDMSKTGGVIGATVKDLTTMAAEWARLGYSMEEAGKLAKSTAILLNVSEFDDATKASEALISTMQAFQYTADESQHVVDVLNEVGNNYAISSDGIATALQDSASALMEGGNNLEQAVALVASANRVVQDPNSVGSALRTISLRLRGTSVKILEEMGEETDNVIESTSKLQSKIKALSGVNILTESGDYKDTYTILKEIGTVWEDMSDIDQAALLELMAGKNRANTLSAILSNMEDLEGAYESAMDAEGSALRENETYLDSIQGRIDLFNNSVQTMWMNLINSETVKDIVDVGTTLVKFLDTAHGKLIAISAVLAGLAKWKLKVNFTDMFTNMSGKLMGKDTTAIALQKMQSISGTGAQAIDKYVLALKNLSAAQQAQVLASKGLAESEQLVILTRSLGSEAAAKKAMAEAALATSQQKVTGETLIRTIATKTQNAEYTKSFVVTTGITGATAELTEEQIKAALAALQQAKATGKLSDEQYEAIVSTVGLDKATEGLNKNVGGLGEKLKGFWSSNKFSICATAIAAAIAIIAAAFDKLHKTAQEAADEADEAFQKIRDVADSTASYLSSLQSELQTIQSQIDDLTGKELSLTDSEELKRLKKQKDALQDSIDRQEYLLELQEQTANEQAVAAMKAYTKASSQGAKESTESWKTWGSVVGGLLLTVGGIVAAYFTGGSSLALSAKGLTMIGIGGAAGAYAGGVAGEAIGSYVNENDGSYDSWYKTYKKSLDAAKEARDDAYEEYAEDASDLDAYNEWKEAQQKVTDIEAELYDNLNKMQSFYSGIEYGTDPMMDAELDAFYRLIDKISIDNNHPNAIVNALDRLFGEDADEVVKAYANIAKNAVEAGEAFNFTEADAGAIGLDDDLEELGITTQQVTNYFKDFGKAGADAIEEIDVKDLVSELAKIEGALESVKSVMEEFRTEGIVSASTLEGMQEEFGGLGGVWENYVEIMMSGTASMAEVKAATDALAKAYLDSNANNINKDTRLTYIAQLEQFDVKNAAELVDSYMNNSFLNSSVFANFKGNAEELIELAKEYGVTIEDTAKAEELLKAKEAARTKQAKINHEMFDKAEVEKRNKEKQENANRIHEELSGKGYHEFNYWIRLIEQVENREGLYSDYTDEQAERVIASYKNTLAENISAYGYTLEDIFPTLEVVPEITVSQAEVDAAEKEYQDALDKMDLSVTPEIDLDPRNQIENMADWEEAIKSLSGVYNELLDDGKVSASSLVGLADTFDIVGAKEEYEEFVNILSTAKADAPEVRDAFENLTAAYLVNSGALEDVTEETEAMTIAKLREMGVINAEAVAHKALLINQMRNITSIERLKTATDEQIESEAQVMATLAAEAGVSLTAAEALNTLKYYRELYNIEDITSVTATEAEGLIVLAKSANIAANELANLQKVADFIANKDKMRSDFFKSKNPGNHYVYASMAMLWEKEFEKIYSEQLKQLYAGVGTEYTPPNFEEIIRNSLGGLDFSGLFGDAANGGSDSSTELDWLDHYFTKIENKIKEKEAELENVMSADISSITEKNTIIDDVIGLYEDKVSLLNTAMNAYSNRAAQLLSGFNADIQQKIKDGSIDISKYDDETAEKIQDYFDYITKASDLGIEIGGIKVTIADFSLQKFDNASTAFDNEIEEKFQSDQDLIEAEIGYLEEQGKRVSPELYEKLIQVQKEEQKVLENKKKTLENILATEIAVGHIEIGSEQWYEMTNAINDVDEALIESKNDIESFKNSINEIYWDNFEKLIDQIDAVNSELSNLFDLLSEDDKVVDEFGNWTDEGIASLGLLAQQMENAKQKSEEYKQAMDDLQDNKANYSIDEFNEKMAELKENYLSELKNIEDLKDAMVDLNKVRVDAVKEAIDKEIEALEEKNEKLKEELNLEKEQYDFQKQVAEQEKSVADIRRRLNALAGDTSASAIAERRKLEAELAEAQQEMDDMWYEHSIEEQQKSLDESLENYKENKEDEKEALDEWLEEEEKVIQESFDLFNSNVDIVSSVLKAFETEHGINLTKAIVNPWNSGIDAMTAYRNELAKMKEDQNDAKKNAEDTADDIVESLNEPQASAPTTSPVVSQTSGTSSPTGSTGGTSQSAGSSTPSYREYTIKKNDTLSDIAQDELGSASRWQEIYNLNKDVISNPNLIYPGQKIKLPHYAKGTMGAEYDHWAMVDELGPELQLVPDGSGRLSYITRGTSVIPHDLSEKLVDLALDPTKVLENSRPAIGAPHITTNNFDIDLSFGSLVHVDHCDQNTLPDLQKMVRGEFDNMMKTINQKLKRK